MTVQEFSRDIVPIIQLVVTTVGLGGLWLVWWQVRADHRRSRIQHACALVSEWTTKLDKHTALAARLFEKLDRQQVQDIYDLKPVKINKRWKTMVEGCLTELEPRQAELQEDGESFLLEEKHCVHIRYLVENFLNITETVLIPWLHGAAETKIIESEFRNILMPPSPFSLATYRDITNSKEKFPAVEAFITYLTKKHGSPGVPQPPIA